MPKYVCMECGCREVVGTGTAVTEIQINEDGQVEHGNLDWEHFEGMKCSECSSDNVLPIGTGQSFMPKNSGGKTWMQ